MDGVQALVGLGGFGLLAANEWTSADRGAFGAILTSPGADVAAAHKALIRVGGELVFIVAAVVLAGVSSTWSSVVLVAIVALWVLWLMHRKAPTGTAAGIVPGATL